jgi:hypothetical protein
LLPPNPGILKLLKVKPGSSRFPLRLWRYIGNLATYQYLLAILHSSKAKFKNCLKQGILSNFFAALPAMQLAIVEAAANGEPLWRF